MAERNSSKSSPKAVCSVSYLAQSLGMSRSRFYQLVDTGVFPPALYDLRSKRPFYDLSLQERCREIRNTGIGFNENYVLFYSSRKQKSTAAPKPSSSQNEHIQEIQEALSELGLESTIKDISHALKTLYPDGTESRNTGEMIREVYRTLKRV
jgi:hypothetical protein